MNLIFSSNDKGVNMMAVAIYSVIKNNQKHRLNFYIIHSNINQKNIDRLKKLQSRHRNANIKFISIDGDQLKTIKITNMVTTEAYYRYLAPDILPKSENRVLYMDIDTLCLSDLSELYNTNLEGKCIAAVEDYAFNNSDDYRDNKAWVHSQGVKKYVNSGVLLMNLTEMRKGIMTEFWDGIYNKPKIIPEKYNVFADQTVTNLIFKDSIKYLDKKYNVFTTALAGLNVKNPAVVHFTGFSKPLTYRDEHSAIYDEKYFMYYWETMNIVGNDGGSILKFAINSTKREAAHMLHETSEQLTKNNHRLEEATRQLEEATRQLAENNHQFQKFRSSPRYLISNLPYAIRAYVKNKLS